MELSKKPTNELVRAIELLSELSDATEFEANLLRDCMFEVHARLGQPRGELHLCVIKGGKDDDFSIAAKGKSDSDEGRNE